jgi:hypothetical protein
MNADTELDNWRSEWQAAGTVPLDLRVSVERQTRAMRLGVLADALVTVTMGGGTTAWAVLSPQPDVILLAAATWVFIAIAWVFAVTVNRGRWAPAALDTNAFLDLSISRCRARLATSTFGSWLAVVEIAFSLAWVYHHAKPRQGVLAWLFFGSVPIDIVWLLAVVFLLLLFFYRGKKRAELEYLLQLGQEALSAESRS